jgi:hypothetical protein
MKNSTKLILHCVMALSLSITSFAADKKEKSGKGQAFLSDQFEATLVRVPGSSKVKLLINTQKDCTLRIKLTGKNGTVYYSEVFSEGAAARYRRSFDMNELSQGSYYFEVHSKGQNFHQAGSGQ